MTEPLSTLPSDILTDPDLQRAYGILMESIKSFLMPEEIDKLLHSYQVQQVRNQYEYILKITAVRHEARLFVLQAQLNLRKLEAQALYIIAGKARIEEMIAHSTKEIRSIVKQYAKEISIDLREVDALPDAQVREITRGSILNAYSSYLMDVDRRANTAAQRIEQLLNTL